MTLNVAIRLSKSDVGQQEIEALAAVIDHGYLGMGADVQAFEQDLSNFLGDREVICVNSATVALQLALQACGIGQGDEVLVPTLTYVATFQAVSATGAVPIACDVSSETGWLDLEDAEKRITKRTKAVIPVHYASGTGDLDQLYELASRHNLRVIEDAAHAFGCLHNGELVGSRGDIVCFSFQGTKNITAGEGGAIVTADAKVADHVKDARLLGVIKDTEKRYAGDRSWEFDVTEQGWRSHMSNLFAAIGRVQLQRFQTEFREKRVFLGYRYRELLGKQANVRLLDLDYGPVVPHIFPIMVGGGMRDQVREVLLREGIETGIHYKPNHLLTRYGAGKVSLPKAERMYEEMLTLPLHPLVTETDQDLVVSVLGRAIAST